MNKNHYDHIIEKFNLDDCQVAGMRNRYHDGYRKVNVNQLYAKNSLKDEPWAIAIWWVDGEQQLRVFKFLPSIKFAEQIIEYIKETEILFV